MAVEIIFINLQESYEAELGLELVNPGSAVRSAINWAFNIIKSWPAEPG